MAANKTMSLEDWGLLLALSLLWGGSYFFTGVAVREVPPLTIVTVRVSIAALALLVLVRAIGGGMPKGRAFWLACFGMGVLNNVVPFSLSAWSQTQIPSGLASVLNATTPLFAVLVTHALTKDEKATPAKLAGVVIGLAGVAVMVGPAVLSGLGSGALGDLAALGAALSYSFSGVFGRRFKAFGLPPMTIAAGQLVASSMMLWPICLLVDRPWMLSPPSGTTVAALIALALFSTALAYILFFRILANAGPTNLMLVTFLIPVSAILLGWLILGERLEEKHFLGMALISLGLAAIDGRVFGLVRKGRTSLARD